MISTLHQPLPPGLQQWFTTRAWTVLGAQRVVGGFAALSIYTITALCPDGKLTRLVYKQMAPERSSERRVYDRLSFSLADYMPRVFAVIDEAEGAGLLLAHAGIPLKSVLRDGSVGAQRPVLLRAVTWLCELHLRFAANSQLWLQDGTLAHYPLSSSVACATEAVENLLWAAEEGAGGIAFEQVSDLKRQAALFYPRLENWMQGPRTLTHGDPHLENFLVHGETFKLIDWEFTFATIPQRDLAIFVQDVLDDRLRDAVYQQFCTTLREAGWPVDEPAFYTGWLACFFDNTLMMLGWEVYKFREGYLSATELERIAAVKLRWLQETFEQLNGGTR